MADGFRVATFSPAGSVSALGSWDPHKGAIESIESKGVQAWDKHLVRHLQTLRPHPEHIRW